MPLEHSGLKKRSIIDPKDSAEFNILKVFYKYAAEEQKAIEEKRRLMEQLDEIDSFRQSNQRQDAFKLIPQENNQQFDPTLGQITLIR